MQHDAERIDHSIPPGSCWLLDGRVEVTPSLTVGLLPRSTSAELEDKLQRQLHVAAFDVAVWRYAFDGPDESAGDVLRSWRDVKIRVVERIEHFSAKLERVPLIQLHVSAQAGVEVPNSGTTKLVAPGHVCRIRTKVRTAAAHRIAKRSHWLSSQVNVIEEVGSAGVGDVNAERSSRDQSRSREIGVTAIKDGEWRAGAGVENSRHRPAVEQSLRGTARALPEGYLPNYAAHEAMPNIKIRRAIVETRIVRISKSQIVVESSLTEGRTQIVIRLCEGVMGGEL